MEPLFTPRANLLARASLAAIVLAVAGVACFGFAYTRSAYYTGVHVPVEQPVPFSHHHHVAGLGIDCRYCHSTVEDSASAGMPTTQTCMNCHEHVWNDSPMLEPVRQSWRTGRPLRWRRVHDMPDFVYFDHSIHVSKGIGCETCHGRVDQMRLVHKEETLFMRWCLDCHRDPAVFLRPPEAVFETGWAETEAGKEHAGADLLKSNNVRIESLTNCSTCHR